MAVAVAALIAASAGLAVAATSTSSPVIRACASKKSGVLRLANRCHKGERALSWSQSGPQGPRGLAGANGVNGAAGQTGGEGKQGPQGPGATSIEDVSLPHGTGYVTLASVGAGVTVSGACTGGGEPVMKLEAAGPSDVIEAGGTLSRGTEVLPDDFLAHELSISHTGIVAFDMVVRNTSAGGRFARISASGSGGPSTPCIFFGIVIPSS